VVGAKGSEPSTSWSRTNHVNPITLCPGLAYGIRSVISLLLVVPNLYLDRLRVESEERSCNAKHNSAAVFRRTAKVRSGAFRNDSFRELPAIGSVNTIASARTLQDR
jgi:hypothetical protein